MLVSLKTSLEKMLVIKSDLVYLFWVSVQKIRPNLTDFAIRTKINVEENRTRDIVNLF